MTYYARRMTFEGDAASQVADRVRQAIQAAGYTPNKVADLCGMAYPTLRRRLNSAPHLFTVAELIRIADATGTNWAYLVAGSEAAA